MTISRLTLFAIIFYHSQSSELRGATLIDQHVGINEGSMVVVTFREGNTGGQSFTPNFSSIQFITLNSLGNALHLSPVEATFRLGLYLGSDRSSPPLLTSSDLFVRSRFVETGFSDPYAFGYHVVDPLTWIFEDSISLHIGEQYSFFVDHISGDDINWSASQVAYGGGNALIMLPSFNSEGAFVMVPIDPSYNFSFSTGAIIPEPSTAFLVILSGFVAFRRGIPSNKSHHATT